MELDIPSNERYYLEKLDKVLKYELSSSVLWFLSYAMAITLFLAVVAAALFTPYMIYVFIRQKKIAWLISFIIVVLGPLSVCILIGLKSDYMAVLLMVPLGFLYFYCFMLKMTVSDRLEEVKAKQELEIKKASEQLENQSWDQRFK
jgi:hypothetical protein